MDQSQWISSLAAARRTSLIWQARSRKDSRPRQARPRSRKEMRPRRKKMRPDI